MKHFIIFSIICVAAFFLFGIWVKYHDKCTFASALKTAIPGTIFAFLIVFGIYMFACSPITDYKQRDELINSQEIIALTLESSQKGEFFLGCGSISGEPYYFYYTQDQNNNIKLHKIKADDVTLRYCANKETPKIEEYTTIDQCVLTKKPTFWDNFFLEYSKYKDNNAGDVVSEHPSTFFADEITKTVIYIPEGSIQNNYNVLLN